MYLLDFPRELFPWPIALLWILVPVAFLATFFFACYRLSEWLFNRSHPRGDRLDPTQSQNAEPSKRAP